MSFSLYAAQIQECPRMGGPSVREVALSKTNMPSRSDVAYARKHRLIITARDAFNGAKLIYKGAGAWD